MKTILNKLSIPLFILFALFLKYEPTIVGKWYLEKDKSIIWEFTKSGEFKDHNEVEVGISLMLDL